MGRKVGKESRREIHNKMKGKNGALARARTRTPCNFALFAFTTFTKLRVRSRKWGVYEGNRNGVRESVVFECWKGRKKGWFGEERRHARNFGFRGGFCAVLWRLWKQKSRNPCNVRARRAEKLTRDFAGQKEVDFEILDRSEKLLIGDRSDWGKMVSIHKAPQPHRCGALCRKSTK